jgi:small conductance mechanosensitive channel
VTIIASSSSGSTPPADNDRGVVYQFLHGLGVSSDHAHTAQVYAIGPIRILLILLFAVILSRLITRVSAKLVSGLRLVSPVVRTTPRGEQRAQTLTGVLASLLRAVIWVTAILTILAQLDINLLPFVATATVIGAALGFGAQSLVKDFLSGVLIIAEDQYEVGDHIIVGTGPNATIGMVEAVNLRITRLRSLEGVVWYVPNGDIRTVGNDTETDSQALVDIVVPPGTDLAAAGASAESAVRSLAVDPAWQGVFIGEPLYAGVEAIRADGITLRVLAWTKPSQQARAARELRMRVIERLREDGVAWPAIGTTNGQS